MDLTRSREKLEAALKLIESLLFHPPHGIESA
jgi:hypothetical protein